MRTQRAFSIQTWDQYYFCYTAVMEYAQRNGKLSPVQWSDSELDTDSEWGSHGGNQKCETFCKRPTWVIGAASRKTATLIAKRDKRWRLDFDLWCYHVGCYSGSSLTTVSEAKSMTQQYKSGVCPLPCWESKLSCQFASPPFISKLSGDLACP